MISIEEHYNKLKENFELIEALYNAYPEIQIEYERFFLDINYHNHLHQNILLVSSSYFSFYTYFIFKYNDNPICIYSKIINIDLYTCYGRTYSAELYHIELKNAGFTDEIIRKVDELYAKFIIENKIKVDLNKVNNRLKTFLMLS